MLNKCGDNKKILKWISSVDDYAIFSTLAIPQLDH